MAIFFGSKNICIGMRYINLKKKNQTATCMNGDSYFSLDIKASIMIYDGVIK